VNKNEHTRLCKLKLLLSKSRLYIIKNISIGLISSSVAKSPCENYYSFVFDEIFRLAKLGSDVHIIRSFQEADSTEYGLHFHGLDNSSRVKNIPFLFKHLNLVPKISYTLPPWTLLELSKYAQTASNVTQNQNLDLIHAHFAYPEGFVGLLAKKETKRPLVITVHGADILVEPSIGYGLRIDKRIDGMVRGALNEADAVIAASTATYNEVKTIVEDVKKINLIPNGVDTERFNVKLDPTKLREKLGIMNKTAVIFTLRAHEKKYGLEYLIRAAATVVKRKPNAIFLIGGDGSLRGHYEKLAADLGLAGKVIFTGKISSDLVQYYYAMSDIVVVPSVQEAFGLVVSEAMASGKPVIGTRVGGIPDQIIDGYNGFLVNPKDSVKISEKIFWLFEHENEAKQMGLNGRKIAEDRFNITKRIDSVISLYKKLID
jgi:N-acetyl-alpha-D-glucosaminyl L-malate synthase BshA